MRIEFHVDGIPKGQPRPRAFVRGGHAAVYDPGTAEGWKSAIAQAVQPHRPEQPLTGALDVTIDFHMPRPKSHYRTGKHAGELKSSAPRWHIGKPDIDNLLKACLDALTALHVWFDDAQIAALTATKEYSDRPGAVIIVETLI